MVQGRVVQLGVSWVEWPDLLVIIIYGTTYIKLKSHGYVQVGYAIDPVKNYKTTGSTSAESKAT